MQNSFSAAVTLPIVVVITIILGTLHTASLIVYGASDTPHTASSVLFGIASHFTWLSPTSSLFCFFFCHFSLAEVFSEQTKNCVCVCVYFTIHTVFLLIYAY